MQTCKTCNESKPFDAFLRRRWKLPDGTIREGYRKECKVCQNAYERATYRGGAREARRARHYAANKEKNNEYTKAYYRANKDKWLNRASGWRFSDRARNYDLAYRRDPQNMARKSEYAKLWRIENRPRLLLKTLGRLEKVRLATPFWVTREMLLPFYEASKRMEHLTGVKHHVDHYYPLVSDVVCGLHVPANLRVIPAIDNLVKANKFPT